MTNTASKHLQVHAKSIPQLWQLVMIQLFMLVIALYVTDNKI